MRFSINSRKLGGVVEFSRPGSEYIYVDFSEKNPGSLGHQICYGGGFSGATMSYGGEDMEKFERICRNWFRNYLKGMEVGWNEIN